MKYILMLLFSAMSINAWAGKCEYVDTTVDFTASTWALTPKTFYAKEGDRICVRFSTTDSSKSLFVQNTPVFIRAFKDKPAEEALVIARKTGTLKVTCNGCQEHAVIIVQSKREFDDYQKKMDRFNSLQNRNPHYLPSGRR